MPKTGADHLNSLRDGRTIYLDGQRIADVVEHPAYRNAIRSTAYLGMVMGLEVFEHHSAERAGALLEYFSYARDHDLFVTYVIINPQADRAKGVSEQADEFLVAAICAEDATGITIKGAKMLGTSSIMANEVLVTSMVDGCLARYDAPKPRV